MKPAPFRYHDPQNLEDALDLLAGRENAKLLAGGQSLMPMLNMRLVMPDDVIDLNRISELAYIREDGDRIEIGGMTRQRDLEDSQVIRRRCPLMHEALLQVGHRQIRNRGTIGGSLCHLDPAAELPVVAATLDASIRVRSARGERTLPMSEFPAFYMTPSIEPDEIVTAIDFEAWPDGHGSAFVEFARRSGDFAIVGVAALLQRSSQDRIGRASVTVGGVGPAPVRCAEAEDLLTADGTAAFAEAAEACRPIEAMDDVHAPSVYRQHLAVELTKRALRAAWDRAS